MEKKSGRKKQAIPALEKCGASFEANKSSFPLWIYATDKDPFFVHGLIEKFLNNNGLDDCMKAISSLKAKIRASLQADEPSVGSTASDAIVMLTQLLVLPNFYPLRNSLDWIADTLTVIKVTSPEDVKESVQLCCKCVTGLFNVQVNSLSVEGYVGWSYSFCSMAELDKSLKYLGDELIDFSKSPTTVATLFDFLSKLEIIMAQCTSKATSCSTSAEVSRHFEAVGEAFRAVSIVLKDRASTVSWAAFSVEWKRLITSILRYSLVLLASPVTSKDEITSATMCLVSIFRLANDVGADLGQAVSRVKFLLYLLGDASAIDMAMLASAPELECTGIDPEAAVTIVNFRSMVKCGMFRAIISNFRPEILLWRESATATCLLMGPVLSQVMSACNDRLTVNRLYGFQTLETWLSQMETLLKKSSALLIEAEFLLVQLREEMKNIAKQLIAAWLHPARQINHIAPSLYQQILLISSLAAQKSADKASVTQLWKAFFEDAKLMPSTHRGKYQAINSLLPYIGACNLLAIDPSLIVDLIQQMAERDVVSSVSTLLGTIVKQVLKEDTVGEATPKDPSSARALWLVPLCQALCNESEKFRVNIADYLIPELVSIDAKAIPPLMQQIRTLQIHSSNAMFLKYWALSHLCLYARLHDLEGLELADPASSTSMTPGLVTREEVAIWCTHEDTNLRLTSFTLLTASLRTSLPLNPTEFTILQDTFLHSLKSSDSDYRHKIIRVVKALLTRVKESSRVAEKDIKKQQKAIALMEKKAAALAAHEEEEVTKLRAELTASAASIDRSHEVIRQGIDFLRWLQHTIMQNLYPGTTGDREVMTLDILRCVFETLEGEAALLSLFQNKDVVCALLNIFISSWDRSRKTVCELLLLLPSPWPGFENETELRNLLGWSDQLMSSVRLRESDAGALMLRSLFMVYYQKLSWKVPFPTSAGNTVSSGDEAGENCIAFVSQMCAELSHRLVLMKDAFDKISTDNEASGGDDFPLCHGLISGLKLCVCEALEAMRRSKSKDAALWQPVIQTVYRETLHALSVAMTVVAEASSDVPFAPVSCNSEEIDAYTKGPVNTATASAGAPSSSSMAATYVNTNSVMSFTAGEEEVDDGSSAVQRSVVAAWLLVKEACALLATLLESCPLPLESAASSVVELVSFDDINAIGARILDALGRLKHMGAISEAYFALQRIASVLMRHGERHVGLCRLPIAWLESLLAKLDNEQQVFILRRSAGFAYSFLSLLRAEPGNCKPTLLPIAMTRLLDTVQISHSNPESSLWKMAVHALNVLRLIIADGTIGPELDAYVGRAAELAVQGFHSAHWAVRNSCMMVFSSVVQRAVDNDKSESGSSSATSFQEFFLRFPNLYPYFLTELAHATDCDIVYDEHQWPVQVVSADKRAVAAKKTALTGSTVNQSEYPTLYPLLLLISKFRVELLASEETSKKFSPQLFVFMIESCSSQRNHHVRWMAAKSLAALIPMYDVTAQVVSRWKALEQVLATESPAAVSLNNLHGKLCGINEILQTLLVQSKRAKIPHIVDELLKEFLPRLHRVLEPLVARHRYCPSLYYMTQKLLNAARNLSQQAHYLAEISTVIYKFNWAVIQRSKVNNCVKEYTQLVTFEALVWREAVSDVTQYMLRRSADTEQVECWLYHGVSEVRQGALDGVLSHLSSSADNGDKQELLSHFLELIFDRMLLEKEPPLLEVIFKVVQRICELCTDATQQQTVIDPKWITVLTKFIVKRSSAANGVESLHTHSAAPIALNIFGWMIRYAYTSSDTTATITASHVTMLSSWTALVECAGHQEQSTGLRESAANSLRTSKFLPWTMTQLPLAVGAMENSTDRDALLEASLRAWKLALSLLQDDDCDVREMANAACCQAFHPDNPTASTTEMCTVWKLSGAIAKIIQMSDAHASSEALKEQLRLCLDVVESGMGSAESISALFQADRENLSKKIFEAEQANLFIEESVSALVMLNALCLCNNSAQVHAELSSFTTKHLNNLSTVLDSIAAYSQWMCGGITYEKDLYRYVQVAAAIVKSFKGCMGEESARKEADKVLERICHSGVHPLLRKAVLL